jgi:hypothetical protein
MRDGKYHVMQPGQLNQLIATGPKCFKVLALNRWNAGAQLLERIYNPESWTDIPRFEAYQVEPKDDEIVRLVREIRNDPNYKTKKVWKFSASITFDMAGLWGMLRKEYWPQTSQRLRVLPMDEWEEGVTHPHVVRTFTGWSMRVRVHGNQAWMLKQMEKERSLPSVAIYAGRSLAEAQSVADFLFSPAILIAQAKKKNIVFSMLDALKDRAWVIGEDVFLPKDAKFGQIQQVLDAKYGIEMTSGYDLAEAWLKQIGYDKNFVSREENEDWEPEEAEDAVEDLFFGTDEQ